MRQFRKILRFEFGNYLQNKIFVFFTLIMVLAITGVMFFPRISEAIRSGKARSDASSQEELPVMLIKIDSEEEKSQIMSAFSQAFPDYQTRLTEASEEEIKAEILSREAACAFVLKNNTSCSYYVRNLSMSDTNAYTAQTLLRELYRLRAMTAAGIDPARAADIMETQIDIETENLGKDQGSRFSYTYIMITALYCVLVFYGQMVATNVASEKSSRAMELLITSAKPVSMMFGKIVSSCLAGFLQLAIIFGAALLGFHLNRSYWADNRIISSTFGLPPSLFGYMLLFFLLGFFLYAFLYGAVGSTVSKMEDVSAGVMPLTMLLVIAFLIVVYSLTGDIDSTLMQVCSLVPFTSPIAMFTRIAMSTVPLPMILLSVAILIASVFGIGVLSAKIYRVGVLLYGTRPRIRSVLKSIRSA